MARVFGPISWVHTALFWSGVGCCALGLMLVALAVRAPSHSSDAASLLIAGLAIQESSRGGVVLRSTAGAPLRLAAELAHFQELVDLLCDRITDNGYPVTATSWQHGERNITVGARDVSAHWLGHAGPRTVGSSAIQELWLERDERRRLVVGLTLEDGEELRFPHIGNTQILEVYRALRQTLSQRRRPLPTATRRQLQRRTKAKRTHSLALAIISLGGLAGAALVRSAAATPRNSTEGCNIDGFESATEPRRPKWYGRARERVPSGCAHLDGKGEKKYSPLPRSRATLRLGLRTHEQQ